MNNLKKKKNIKLLQGNEACVEGAILAGVRFFAGYPITPSSEIAENMAAQLGDQGEKPADTSPRMKISEKEIAEARKDPKKYIAHAEKAGVSQKTINSNLAQYFPDYKPEKPKAKKPEAKPVKKEENILKGFSTPEKRASKEESVKARKAKVAESMTFLDEKAVKTRDVMGFTEDGAENMKKAKIMSDAMVSVRKQIKAKKIDNWDQFEKDAKTAAPYLSRRDKKTIKAILQSRSK